MKLNKRKMKLNKEDSSLKKVQMLFFPFLLSQSLISSLKLSDKYSSFVEISIYPLSLRFISIQFLNKIPTLSNITNLTLINLTKNLYSSFHTSSFYISFSRYSVSLAIFHANFSTDSPIRGYYLLFLGLPLIQRRNFHADI